MAAMGQQPLRSPSQADDAGSRKVSGENTNTDTNAPTASASATTPPSPGDDVVLKQILADLRAMGEKLSVATKRQIQDIALRGSDGTGPEPASHPLLAAEKAMAKASSTAVDRLDREEDEKYGKVKSEEEEPQAQGVSHCVVPVQNEQVKA